jgi:hypothetical protein
MQGLQNVLSDLQFLRGGFLAYKTAYAKGKVVESLVFIHHVQAESRESVGAPRPMNEGLEKEAGN